MGEIAKLFVVIGSKFDPKGLDATIDKAKQVEKRTENITKGFKIAGAALTAFAAAGVLSMIKLTGKASDLEETTSKFNTVFEEQIILAEEWSKELVKSYGVSTEQSKRFLASIQDLLVPMGMQSDVAAKLSNEVVKLSIDLGSFNNMPTEKVMLDIQSALVGNFETMKKYGVVLNETRISQHILNQGLVDHKSKITQSMKAQAAYELVIEGSQAALGDFVRTSDGFANMVKIMQARIEDLAAKLGDKLIPTMKSLVGLVSDVTGFLQNLSPDVFEATAKFLLLATAIAGILGPLALFIGFIPQIVIGITQVGAALKIATAGLGGWVTAIVTATVVTKALLFIIDKWIDRNNTLAGQRAKDLKTTEGKIAALEKQIVKEQELFKLSEISSVEMTKRVEQHRRAIERLKEKQDEATEAERARAEATMKAEALALAAATAEAAAIEQLKIQAKSFQDSIANGTASTFEQIIIGAESVGAAVPSIFENIKLQIIRQMSGVLASNAVKGVLGLFTGGASSFLSFLPGFANGVRNFSGGMAVVGENGPEIAHLPRGTNVYSNNETKNITGGESTIVNVTVNQVSSRVEARRQAEITGDVIISKIKKSRKLI